MSEHSCPLLRTDIPPTVPPSQAMSSGNLSPEPQGNAVQLHLGPTRLPWTVLGLTASTAGPWSGCRSWNRQEGSNRHRTYSLAQSIGGRHAPFPFLLWLQTRMFCCRLGLAYLMSHLASRKAPGILVGLGEARSVGLLSAAQRFLGLWRWSDTPGRAAVDQRGLSLEIETFPGGAQAANPQPSHSHLSQLPADAKGRPKRVSQRTGHLSVIMALALSGVNPGV